MALIKVLTRGPATAAPGADTSQQPHILLVLDCFPKTLGGGEGVVLRLAERLPRYGFLVSILTFAVHPESSFRPADAPCPVYLLPLRNTYGPHAWRAAFALRRFLRQQDIKLMQTFFESSDLWAGLVCRLGSRAKLVWSRRDMGILRGRKHNFAYRALRRLPHAVNAVSERVAHHVIEVDGVPAPRVHVIHNGLDLDAEPLSMAQRGGHARTITTIGNIRQVKGHDLLIGAVPKVLAAFPDAIFTIAGAVLEPEFFQGLSRQVADKGLSENVHFLGKVTKLREHLGQADIFILPSRSEGFSNALVEAMAAGLPCIATDVGGNAEAIQDGCSGLIVPPEDPDSLSTAILRLLEDEELRRRLGAAAQMSARTNFSSDAMLRKTVNLYRQFLQS